MGVEVRRASPKAQEIHSEFRAKGGADAPKGGADGLKGGADHEPWSTSVHKAPPRLLPLHRPAHLSVRTGVADITPLAANP